jgi:preprotein translocase subunit SecE
MSVANMAATDNNGEVAKTGGPGTWLPRAKEYYADMKGEMGKVTWPTRDQVYATTAVVVVCVFAFAAYFAVVDMILARVIGRLFDFLAK